jgi:hypothetical protein
MNIVSCWYPAGFKEGMLALDLLRSKYACINMTTALLAALNVAAAHPPELRKAVHKQHSTCYPTVMLHQMC